MTSRRATEPGHKLHTAPIDGVTIEGSEMPNETTIARALDRLGATVEKAAKLKKTRSSVSPSTLAALRDDSVETRRTLAARLERSETVRRFRSGISTPGRSEEIFSRREFADDLRTRTTVTNATGVVVPAWTRDTADLPEQGNRLAGLFRIREAPEPAIGVSEETAPRAAVVAPQDYGSSLPESSATYTRTELTDSRFGAYVHAWRSILDDSAALADALDYVLNRDLGRQLDVELLSGDGTGTAYGKHFIGLANLGLTSQDATALGSRWVALTTAAGAIRAADWGGPITTILHPTDFVDLAIERTPTQNAPVFADALDGLEKLGADNFVLSALQPVGTAWVGSWSEFGTVYVRAAPSIAIARSDQSDFVNGMVKLQIEARLAFRAHTGHVTAAQKVINF